MAFAHLEYQKKNVVHLIKLARCAGIVVMQYLGITLLAHLLAGQ